MNFTSGVRGLDYPNGPLTGHLRLNDRLDRRRVG